MKTSNNISYPKSSQSPSYLTPGLSKSTKSNDTQQGGTFKDFDLVSIRDRAIIKHNLVREPPRNQRSNSDGLESPDRLFSLKEKISSIGQNSGMVKQAKIYLDNKEPKKHSYHTKQSNMPDKMTIDALTKVRMLIENCTHEQVENLSSNYVAELMSVQQSIFRNLRQIPSFKGRV